MFQTDCVYRAGISLACVAEFPFLIKSGSSLMKCLSPSMGFVYYARALRGLIYAGLLPPVQRLTSQAAAPLSLLLLLFPPKHFTSLFKIF